MAKEKSTRTKSQSGRYAKTKGANFERWIVNMANPLLEPLGWELSRTARSGGWMATSRDRSLARLRSDITSLDTRSEGDTDTFPLFLEAKNRENWSLDALPKVGLLGWEPYKWYKEAVEKAIKAAKTACLIFTRNQMPALVMMTQTAMTSVCSELPENAMWVGVVDSDLVVVTTFEEFLPKFVEKQKETRCP